MVIVENEEVETIEDVDFYPKNISWNQGIKNTVTRNAMTTCTDLITETIDNRNEIIFNFIKRIFDIISSSIALILLSPLFLIISVVIKLDSKGPVLFVHKRLGKNGKEIGIYKFRTMVENAEYMIDKLSYKQKKEFEKNYKINNDPRITKIGDFLRKTSLDELPQLINILNGDMSVVGPRPIIKKELEKYGYRKNKFLSITPGLTGFWQANGRSCTSYAQRIQMELYYIDHHSIWLDIKIIFKTFVSVLKRQGAK